MRIPRIHIPRSLQNNLLVELPKEAARHVVRVLRLRQNDRLVLFNGEGGEYPARIELISGHTVRVRTESHQDRNPESPLHITLAQGIPRGERMDFCLQKSTELGVARIAPLLTRRCNVQLRDERKQKRIQRWQGVLTSACEQSGRTRLPELLPVQTLDDWLQHPDNDTLKLVLHHRSTQCVTSLPGAEKIILLTGPEGGLSEEEIEQAQQAGYQPLRLGPRVLRTETAALTAIAALQTLMGDFGENLTE